MNEMSWRDFYPDGVEYDFNQKNLGAFYTPKLYAEKALELVRIAINRVPKDNDYIILDRCAGIGNLEYYLTNEELSHTIINTLEYREYKVLSESFGNKVRHIIHSVGSEGVSDGGLDALSQEFVESEIIQRYIKDPKCTIILFENPPYSTTTSIEHQKRKIGKESSIWKKSYVVRQMKKEIKGVGTNDMANVFIWSAFKYYLRQPTDSYVVFSPIKYWKSQHLIDKQFIKGFAFNQRHFYTASDRCIVCALWGNESANITSIDLDGYDINTKNGMLETPIKLEVKKIYSLYHEKYYERPLVNSSFDGIVVGLNGLEAKDNIKKKCKDIFNACHLGYLIADGSDFFLFDLHSSLLIASRYDSKGFFLTKDNYLEKLPMFCASRYIAYSQSWTEYGRIMKSADGSDLFFKDVANGKLDQMLLKCLLFTCLETHNHMRSFTGSDGRFYRNELCLDCTNGETIAARDLRRLLKNNVEIELIELWNKIFKDAIATQNYDKNLTYGVFQIIQELNTYYKGPNKGKRIYDYPELNKNLGDLKQLLKQYYLDEIVPFLFQYEFLK